MGSMKRAEAKPKTVDGGGTTLWYSGTATWVSVPLHTRQFSVIPHPPTPPAYYSPPFLQSPIGN